MIRYASLFLLLLSAPASATPGADPNLSTFPVPGSTLALLLCLVLVGYCLMRSRQETARVRQTLSSSEEHLRLVLDASGEALFGLDLQGNVTFCNPACLQLFGYRAAEEVLGKNMHALVHHSRPDGTLYPETECAVLKALGAGLGAQADDEVLWRRDGSSFPAAFHSYPQFRDGQLCGAVISIRDVTERRFRESAHQQTVQLLHLASAHSDLNECMRVLTASLKKWSGCEAVGIRLGSGDGFPYVETRGFAAAFVEKEHSVCALNQDGVPRVDGAGRPVLECLCGSVLRGSFDPTLSCYTPRGSFWTNDLSTLFGAADPAATSLLTRNSCGEAGYRSVALVPMHSGTEIVGLIQFNDSRPDRFSAGLLEIYQDLADKVALALSLRQAENELHNREKLHRDLLNQIPDLIWLKNPDGVYLSCNSTFERFYGAQEAEIVGKTDYDFVARELADSLRAHDRAALETEGLTSYEEWITFADDGHRALLYTTKMPLYDADGALVGILGVGRDITPLRQAEEAMQESQRRLRFALEGTNDGLWDVNFMDGGTYLSPRGCEILGYCEDELDEVMRVWSDLVHPDDLGITNERLTAHLEGRAAIFDVEQRLRTKSGQWKWIHARGKVVQRGADGTPLRITGTHSDITERKHLEDQLHHAQKLESVGRLAGGIAHDFNNMLGVIMGHAGLALLKQEVPASIRMHLDEINKASQRSADLTRQLLAFARRQTIAPRLLDLNETISGMLSMLQRLIGEGIKLVWVPGNALWQVKVDPSQIDQIMANLCVNARDAIADIGRIAIETGTATLDQSFCQHHPDASPGDYVWISVQDDGCGMDQETLSHIYEPFFTTKPLGSGTGLGLATVYGALRQNDGFISVSSEPGRGTAFTLYLPGHRGSAGALGEPEKPRPLPRGTETVLLVEDEQAILEMAGSVLKGQGYRVLAAETVAAALRLARQEDGQLHLLVTDVIMPEMSGRALADLLVQDHPRLRHLFMSGYTADVIAQHGILEAGLQFIQKPFSLSELVFKVREVLDETLAPGPINGSA